MVSGQTGLFLLGYALADRSSVHGYSIKHIPFLVHGCCLPFLLEVHHVLPTKVVQVHSLVWTRYHAWLFLDCSDRLCKLGRWWRSFQTLQLLCSCAELRIHWPFHNILSAVPHSDRQCLHILLLHLLHPLRRAHWRYCDPYHRNRQGLLHTFWQWNQFQLFETNLLPGWDQQQQDCGQ